MRRPAGEAQVLVVGVYPSALHVAWSPPPFLDRRSTTERSRPHIGALAVDVEPVVFWDGREPSAETKVNEWREEVGFDPALHGAIRAARNGPSGSGLTDTLGALGLSPDSVAFTDAVPWFFVKAGKGSQGEAQRERFAPRAREMGVDVGRLPERPSTSALVRLAMLDRPSPLAGEIVDAGAPVVVTLGQEALDAVRAVADRSVGLPDRLGAEGYGKLGEINIAGHQLAVLPLVNPGFERQTKRPEWLEALESWRAGAIRILRGSA